MSSLQDTPRSDRIHIVLVGRRNAGKSSLINALTGHRTAIVSDVAGTTTDPVYKSMEIHGLGPCVLVDTAGFDDEGGLGALRLEKTADALDKADIAVLVVTADGAVDDFALNAVGWGNGGTAPRPAWSRSIKRTCWTRPLWAG